MSKRIPRRTALRGAGAVVIGLPLLEEMISASPACCRSGSACASRQCVLWTRDPGPTATGRVRGSSGNL
jgi:hypothetical protein